MNGKILKTAVLYMLFSLLNQAVGLFIQLSLMKGVSIANYGEYAINFEAMALMQIVLANAYRNYYLQKLKVSNNKSERNSLVSFQIINGSLTIFIFGLIVSFAYRLEPMVAGFLVLSNVISSLILPLQSEWLANNERAKIVLKDILTSILSLIAVFLCIKLYNLSVSQISIIQFIIIAIVSLVFFVIFADFKFNFQFLLVNGFVFDKKILVFLMIFIVNALHNRYGGIFLRHYSSEIQVALYLAAFKFINPLFFIQSSLISAFMPSFIKEKEFKFDYKVFFTFGVPGALIALVLWFMFPSMLSILHIEQYLPSYPIVKVACLFIFIVFIYGAMSNYISISGGQTFILIINILALFSMCLVTLVFSNIQEVGLMLITIFVFAECFICIAYYFYLIYKKVNISVIFIIAPIACGIFNAKTMIYLL
ncbi:MATE family efflux transporter [Enterobacter adelaidei]